MADHDPKPADVFNRDKSQWPMTYALSRPSENAPPRRWWRHYYYEGPHGRKVDVVYSKTKSHSEILARQFLNEPVLGFDMEWPWDADKRPKLREKVALIQLASEEKVALFHIALHEGDIVDDLIAPTLKEIIESSTIMKVGVAVINADFKRLRVHFNLHPKGAFELSHLHNLVTYGAVTPHLVTTKLRSLSTQVEQHLGLPLWKGNVRTSDWSRPLNWNQTQYAATDAYACFMLFHCMNAKRLVMDPVPPFPRLAETYLCSTAPKSTTLQLESLTEDGRVLLITAKEFFSPLKDEQQDRVTAEDTVSIKNDDPDSNPKIIDNVQGKLGEGVKVEKGGKETTSKNTTPGNEKKARKARKDAKPVGNNSVRTSMDSSCWSLYSKLVSHRREIAVSKGISAFIIAHNTVLQALTLHRPSNEGELLLVPGIGKGKAAQYGPAWLEIIANFEREEERGDDHGKPQEPSEQAKDGTPMEPEDRDSKRRRTAGLGQPPGTLSTGLTFQFGETSLAEEPSVLPQPREQDDSSDDDNSVFGPPMELPSPWALKRKRHVAVPSAPERQLNLPQSTTQVAVSLPELVPPIKLEPATVLASTYSPIPASTVGREHLQTPPGRSGWEKTILRNKLEAYVKTVIWTMQPKPSDPLISEDMLHYLVNAVPRTLEEFRRAPGMQRLMKACESVKMDIWRTFEKWTRDDRPSAGLK
ncbi:hypothetical protein F4680DRAFT_116358 [Xylaria scruposa]|nr:hypothetical protein F4680DRAFT_116358 [Xylaria scruposa]